MGLATSVCVVTITLAVTGRLGLYINPDSTWFAVGMAVLGVVLAVASFLLPAGSEADHGHDHGHGGHVHAGEDAHLIADEPLVDDRARAVEPDAAALISALPAWTPPDDAAGLSRRELRDLRERHELAALHALRDDAPDPLPVRVPNTPAPVESAVAPRAERGSPHAPTGHDHHLDAPRELHPVRRALGLTGAVVGGLAASAVVALMLVLPPASLSAEAAAQRDIGSPPLFGGDDVVVLAASGDTADFGVGEWAAVFATTGDPAAFDGQEVSLTGFLAAGDGGAPKLSRLVVTHCVIDAQPASLALAPAADLPASDGQWITVDGVIREQEDGALRIEPTTVTAIDEPADPYEY